MKIRFKEEHQTSLNGIDIVVFKEGDELEHEQASKYIERGVAFEVSFQPEETKVIEPEETKIVTRGRKKNNA